MKSIDDILKRNHRVELDKAWETSKTRRLVIASITYLVAVAFMKNIGVPDPFFNAMVPTGGYLLSTLTLPLVKNWWITKHKIKNQD